jgi:hypothetical protein
MILAHLRTAVLAAFPGLDAPKKAFFRIVRAVTGRLNLQPVNATLDQTKDLSAVEVCPGVPGVTSDPTDGETPVVAFVGKDETPFVVARAAEGMPGHTPVEVRHDATSAIRFVSKAASAGAKVYVGDPTTPVAMAIGVEAMRTAAATFAVRLSVATTLADVVSAGSLYAADLGAISNISSTNLEAK